MGKISDMLISNEVAPNDIPIPKPQAMTLIILFSVSSPYRSHNDKIAEAPEVLPKRSRVIGIRLKSILVFFAICFSIYRLA